MRSLLAARQAQAAAMRQKAAKDRLAKYAQVGDKQFIAQQDMTLRDIQMQNLLQSIQETEDVKLQAAKTLEATLAKELADIALKQETEQKADTVRLMPSKGVLDSAKLAAEFQLTVLRDQAMKAAVNTQQVQYQALLARAMAVRTTKLQKVDPEIELANRAFERTTVNTLTTLMNNNPAIRDILNNTGTKVARVRTAKTASRMPMLTSQQIVKTVIDDVNTTSNSILAAYTKRFLTESELGGQLTQLATRIATQTKQRNDLVIYQGALGTFRDSQSQQLNVSISNSTQASTRLGTLRSNLGTAQTNRADYKVSGLVTVNTNHQRRLAIYTFQQSELRRLGELRTTTQTKIATLTTQLAAIETNRLAAVASKDALLAKFLRAAEARTRSALQALLDAKRDMDSAYATMTGLQQTVQTLSTRIDPTQTALETQVSQVRRFLQTTLQPAIALSLSSNSEKSAQLETLRTQFRALGIQTGLIQSDLNAIVALFSQTPRPQKSPTLLQAEATLVNLGGSIALLQLQTSDMNQSLQTVPSRAVLDATLPYFASVARAMNSSKGRLDSIQLSLDTLIGARDENTTQITGFKFQQSSLQNGISVRNVQIRLALFQEQTRYFASQRATARTASQRAAENATRALDPTMNSLGIAEAVQGTIRDTNALLEDVRNTSSSEALINAARGMIEYVNTVLLDLNTQIAAINVTPSQTAFNLADGRLQTVNNGIAANQSLLADAVLQKGILLQLRAAMEAQRNTLQFTQAILLAATNTSSRRLTERALAVTERARAAGRTASAREGATGMLRISLEQSTGLIAMETGRAVVQSELDNALREKTKLDANFRVESMNFMMFQFERLNGVRFTELQQMFLLQLASERALLATRTNDLLAVFSDTLQAQDALAISESDYIELKLLLDTGATNVTQLRIRLGDSITRYGTLLTQGEQSGAVLTDMKQSRLSVERMYMEVLTVVYARERLAVRAAQQKADAATNARLKLGARAEKLRKAQLSVAATQDVATGLALLDTNAATVVGVRSDIQTTLAQSEAATTFASETTVQLSATIAAKNAAQLAADGVSAQIQGNLNTQAALTTSSQVAQQGLLSIPTALVSARASMDTAMNRAVQDRAAQLTAGFTAAQLEGSAASLRATLASLESSVQQAGTLVSSTQDAITAAQAAKDSALQAHAQVLADATTNASAQLSTALQALDAAKAAYQTESTNLSTILQSLSQQDMAALANTRNGTLAVANAKLLALTLYEQTVNDAKAAVLAAEAKVQSLQGTLNAAAEVKLQFESRGPPTKTGTHTRLEATLATQQTTLGRLAGLISAGLQAIAAITATMITISIGLGIGAITLAYSVLAVLGLSFGSISNALQTARAALAALYAKYTAAMNHLSAIRNAKASLSMYMSSMLSRSTMITQLLAKANFFRSEAGRNRALKNGARKAKVDLQLQISETEGRIQTNLNQANTLLQQLNDTNSKFDLTNKLDLSQLNAIIDATKIVDKTKTELALQNANDLKNKIIELKLQKERELLELQRLIDENTRLMELDPSRREELMKLNAELKLQMNKLQMVLNQLNEMLKILDGLKQLLNQLLNDLTKLKTQRNLLNQRMDSGSKLNFLGKWIPPVLILGALIGPLLPIIARGSFGTTPPPGGKKPPEDPNECARGKADGTKAGLPEGQKAGYLRGYLDAQEAYPKGSAGSLFGLTGMPPPSQEEEDNSGPSGPTIQSGDAARLQRLREEQTAQEQTQEGGQVASAISSTEEEQEAQLAPPVEDEEGDTGQAEVLADYLLGKALQGKQTYTRPPDIPVPDMNTIQVSVEGSPSYTQCYITAYRNAYVLGFKQRYYAGFDAWLEELRKYATSGFARELPITPPPQEEEQEGGGEVEPTPEDDLGPRWQALEDETAVEPTVD